MADEMPVPVVMAHLTSSITGRAVMRLMRADDVDVADEAAVQAWLAGHRPALHDALSGKLFDPDAALTWYAANPKEQLGLAGVAEPVRLPDDGELAEQALSVPLMDDLEDLVRAVRRGREAGAADALVLDVAAACKFIERGAGGAAGPGPREHWLAERGLFDILPLWQFVFAATLDAAVPGESGTPLVLQLFRGPLPAGALAGPDPEVTGRLLAALERIGALRVTDGVAALEPLGLLAVATRLEACRVYVPRPQAVGDLTASEIVLLAGIWSGRDVTEDVTAELDAWVARRTPAGAARELLELAAREEALIRVHAARFVTVRLGAAAEQVWHEVLDQPELSCYAKRTLARLAEDRHPGRPQPREFFLTAEDAAWMVVDACSMTATILGPDVGLPLDLADLAGVRLAAQPRLLCEAIARLTRPDARAALVMLGQSENSKLRRAARDAARAA